MTWRAILLVDQSGTDISASVTADGYELTVCSDGARGLRVTAEHPTDLIVLDAASTSPGKPSVRATITYAERGSAPALRLPGTADAADVPGLKDLVDQLPDGWPTEESTHPRPVYRCGDLVVDFEARRVTLGEDEVALTSREYDVLAYLARHAGKIRTVREIFESVWRRPYTSEATYLWTYIRRLRLKLEPNPRLPVYVLSRSSRGYFVPVCDGETPPLRSGRD
jgi:two-component system KDP operon response regulator KdpE